MTITEPQNGRGWKGPLWVTQPNPLPKQGHPQQAAQHHGQAGLEYLQRRRLHSLPGQPGPGLRHPQREEVLPPVQLELPLLQFVPLAPCPVAGHHWKELGPILLTPTLQIFRGISKVPTTSHQYSPPTRPGGQRPSGREGPVWAASGGTPRGEEAAHILRMAERLQHFLESGVLLSQRNCCYVCGIYYKQRPKVFP